MSKENLKKTNDLRILEDTSGVKRACYSSGGMDLFLWFNEKNKALTHFQLTFFSHGDKRVEHIVEWDGKNLKTGLIDSKEVGGRTHDLQTPVVQFYGKPDPTVVKEATVFLKKHGTKLPSNIFNNILEILEK